MMQNGNTHIRRGMDGYVTSVYHEFSYVPLTPKIVDFFTKSATNGSGLLLTERQLAFGWRPSRPAKGHSSPHYRTIIRLSVTSK